MFTKILTVIIAAAVLSTGGYYTYTKIINPEKKEAAAETPAPKEEEKVKEFTDDEVKEAAEKSVELVYAALLKGQEEYDFVKGNYDIEKLKEIIQPIATESFLEDKMPELAEATYCECDANPKPHLAFDSRVEITKENENYIVTAIAAGNDMDNNAYVYTIKLVNDKNELKLDDWSSEQPTENLKLTSDEAAALLQATYEDDFENISEYDAEEDKIYVFTNSTNWEIGVNSVNGMLTQSTAEQETTDADAAASDSTVSEDQETEEEPVEEVSNETETEEDNTLGNAEEAKEPDTQAETAEPASETTINLSDYNGFWSTGNNDGSPYMNFEAMDENTAQVMVTSDQPPNAIRMASVDGTITITDNQAALHYDEDGQGNQGDIHFVFGDGQITVTTELTQKGENPFWMFFDGTHVLYPN
ncbi:hypothetical protein [Terribacillus saccharophilus]|uniref:Uncharacterized protein n=1 Tax=Terribacillus saccharophilus TaxID=361277 RepID=A0ABX4GX29_9BACI|nr:hypothetical protein [Terribacillus saccharophilus]PAD34907.1 hypothetical protein CHH56_12145 [Terribacillus saccharophilus]PAD95657.1 hypothetical protein CHH50_12380 [Terribacillus saccharophilus]PAD99427.1 hypothetical protein CHH48_13275 [Terribacillus saccharophilus]